MCANLDSAWRYVSYSRYNGDVGSDSDIVPQQRYGHGTPPDLTRVRLQIYGILVRYTDLSTQNVCIRKWMGRLQI